MSVKQFAKNIFQSSLIISAIACVAGAQATGVRLPLNTLRDQADTAHCWAYSMSHLLESRSLISQRTQVLIETERDVKYWVDYERMLNIYLSKSNVYLGEYEGGWQIEYFDSFVKHGKSLVSQSLLPQVDILYPLMSDYNAHLPWIDVARPISDPTLPSFEGVKTKLLGTELSTEADAKAYIVDFLDRYYGKPAIQTQWFGENIAVNVSAQKVLGPDFARNQTVESLILIKPVTDGQFGWAKYLDNRFWGYRYDSEKVLSLIETSLNNSWPVTFDNVYHAMTIVGYEKNANGTFYAVADSVPGKITWYSAETLLGELNLVTVFAESIPGVLPPRGRASVLRLAPGENIDIRDKTNFPPR